MHARPARLALALLVGVLVAPRSEAREASPTVEAMRDAATRFAQSLDPDRAAKALLLFDSPERYNWHYIPRERNGLALKDMTSEQKALAYGLLHTGLSPSGFIKATTVMSLEAILHRAENNSPTRDPELYSFTVFGTPSDEGKWGWRVEGHHLCMNYTIDGGKVVAFTPSFFGSNPAEVREGSRKGLKNLPDREDPAFALMKSLDAEQKAAAIVMVPMPKDVVQANQLKPPAISPEGIAASRLTAEQRKTLRAILESYASSLPNEVGPEWLAAFDRSDPAAVRFAWYGEPERGKDHAYRVFGPSVLIEFYNNQNGANHHHTLVRDPRGDFGVPAESAR